MNRMVGAAALVSFLFGVSSTLVVTDWYSYQELEEATYSPYIYSGPKEAERTQANITVDWDGVVGLRSGERYIYVECREQTGPTFIGLFITDEGVFPTPSGDWDLLTEEPER